MASDTGCRAIVTDDGIEYRQRRWFRTEQTIWQCRWAEIKEIVAFKVDCGCYDTIRIGFRFSEENQYWSIDEDDQGYDEMRAKLTALYIAQL